MDIQKKIDELLDENTIHVATIQKLRDKVKSNNRTIGKLRTAITHVSDILGDGTATGIDEAIATAMANGLGDR